MQRDELCGTSSLSFEKQQKLLKQLKKKNKNNASPRVRIASVPRVAAPLQLEPLHAMLILPVPRRASSEAVTQHVARLLCGLDNAAREVQQTGEGSTLVLKLKHVVASVWGSASKGEGGKCGGARERGEARGEQAERGCVVAGCELF